MKKLAVAAAALVALPLAGCSSDADVASQNLSKAAEQFEIMRRIIFFNGITDTQKKHFLGLSDNVTYFAEQLEGAEVGTYHYRVIFKPEVILPDVDRP